jgi:alginate O-acetyltransferase complex protein AlgI
MKQTCFPMIFLSLFAEMVFSSILFLLYFLPSILAVYFIVPRKFKNSVLLVASGVFYAWGAPSFIFVILLTTIVDFFLVSKMDASSNLRHRKAYLITSVGINLGLLVYFKYSNFFIENINLLFQGIGLNPIHWVKLILPIGISFYTFETITYVVDVYRKTHAPLKRFQDYLLYILLFPKLIAGPIIRYHDLADQLTQRPDVIDDKLIGFYRFVLGLAKKVLIANQMGLLADEIFKSDLHQLSTTTAWIGSIAYTMQIYFDFSGYSDMAIGLARMFGFRIAENFDNPYLARSITEFWRRWHISLGTWMKNYLYIPLGGNKVTTSRIYFNLALVFLASGLWHGASWSFVLWGAYHGFFIVLERMFLGRFFEKIGKLPSIAITFFLVSIGWVFFRIEKISHALLYVKQLFSFETNKPYLFSLESKTMLFVALFFSFFAITKRTLRLQQAVYVQDYTHVRHVVMLVCTMVLFVLSVAAITSSGFNPFIYFRF